MPTRLKHHFVFGKGRHKGKRLRQVKKSFFDRGEISEDYKRVRTVCSSKGLPQLDGGIWPSERTSLARIEHNFGMSLQKEIKYRLELGKKPVVVDWGAATGVAITTLAKKFPSIKAYGVSVHSYKEWLKNKRVSFILAEAKNFRRYFKKDSIDVLYSHLGVYHLDDHVQQGYIKSILPALKKGGVLVTDIPYEKMPRGIQDVSFSGMTFRLTVTPWYYAQGDYKQILHHDVLVARRVS